MRAKILSGLAVAVSIALSGASVARAETINLGFAIDGSGSITQAGFDLEKNGLAAALAANIPYVGGIGAHADNGNLYVISVVQFSSAAGAPITATINNATDLANL